MNFYKVFLSLILNGEIRYYRPEENLEDHYGCICAIMFWSYILFLFGTIVIIYILRVCQLIISLDHVYDFVEARMPWKKTYFFLAEQLDTGSQTAYWDVKFYMY